MSDGAGAKAEPVLLPSRDAGFLNALEELSNLPGAATRQIISECLEPEIIDEPSVAHAALTLPAARRSTSRQLLLVTVALSIGGLITGYLWGRQAALSPRQPSAASLKNATLPAADDSAPKTEAPAAGSLPSVSGSIRYTDAAGQVQPDAGALILLLPVVNTSGLRLDARPLRDEQPGIAKDAVESALRFLGVTVTRASRDGTFCLERRPAGEMNLLVISRHASQSDSDPSAPALIALLAQWFDAPIHITGRLAVTQKSLPRVGSEADATTHTVEVTFLPRR